MNKILAIDDKQDNLATIEAILKTQMQACEIWLAQSGKEGIEIAQNQQPDLILLDIIMPGMDGYATCSRLKADETTKHIPVVMVTAIKSDSDSRVKALNLGADAFLSKPIEPVELVAQVKVMLRIKAAEDRLKDENKNLELLIKERTADLEESEKRYRSFLNASNEIAFVKDHHFKYLMANQATAIFFNKTVEELLNKTDAELAEDSIVVPCQSSDVRALTADAPFTIEETLGDKIFETTKFPVRLKNNQIGIGGMLRDITQRKNAEKELRKLTTAIEQSPLSIVITSTKGDIEFVNPGFTRITGYSPEEVKGKNPRLLQSGETAPEVYKNLWDTITARKIWNGVFHNLKKNGELYWESAAIAPVFDEKGRIINYIAIKEDITKQKELIQELVQAKDKAEESDRLKSAFLANMSHEIRTPMNGILGFTSLLKEPDLTGEEQQEYIEIIKKSGDRMLNTVNDIVDISKIEAGLMTVAVSEVNVAEKLRSMYSFFKPEAEKKGIQISLNNSLSKQESIIQTDKEKLNSILTNLIKNAIKYSDKGGIEFGLALKSDNKTTVLEFYVKDTGIGIRKERQKAIFERFIQADIENRDARQGSGLGLAISKAYTEMLGGNIWVESVPGKGSVFYFTIPYKVKSLEKQYNKDVVIVDDNLGRIKKLNIVIAEDDTASVMLLEIMLQSIANNIRVTSTGIETVELCRNNPDIDLVLMDIQMPQMNGFEATRQIRQFNKKVVIIAQTAFALSGDFEKAKEAGCNDYISKPIKKDELLALLQKYFKK